MSPMANLCLFPLPLLCASLSPTHQRRGREELGSLSFLFLNPPLCPALSSEGRLNERGRSGTKSLRLARSHFCVHLLFSFFFFFFRSWRQSAFLYQSKFTKVVCSGFGRSRCVCGKLMCSGCRSIIGLFPCSNLEISILMTMHSGRGAAAAATAPANMRGPCLREYQRVTCGWSRSHDGHSSTVADVRPDVVPPSSPPRSCHRDTTCRRGPRTTTTT